MRSNSRAVRQNAHQLSDKSGICLTDLLIPKLRLAPTGDSDAPEIAQVFAVGRRLFPEVRMLPAL
jgi:hypothetical protein